MRKDTEERKDVEKEEQSTSRKGNSRRSNKKKGSNKSSKNTTKQTKGTASLQTNENIVKNAASFSYFHSLGRKYGFGNANPASAYVEYHDHTCPGIMVLDYIPGPGVGYANTDPINMSADAIYSYVRHMNSGAANYDSNDLMVYLLAAGELYMYWSFAVRTLGLMNIYDTTNSYLPKALVQATGWDFDDLMENQTKLRGAINTAAAMMSGFAVPDILPYFRRMIDMTSRVFTDRDIIKPQLYVFKPRCVRYYSEKTSDKGAELLVTPIPHNGIKASDWINKMNELIAYFRRSEDIGIMSGDILKAYGRENCIVMPAINEDYVVIPEYDEGWLIQIHNARILTYRNDVTDTKLAKFKVYSDVDSGLVKYIPIWSTNQCNQFPYLIDQYISEPSPGDNMDATRLIPNMMYGFALDTDTNQRVWSIISAGTEIIISGAIYRLNANTGELELNTSLWTWMNTDATSEEPARMETISKFDWHPIMFAGTVANVTSANPKYDVNQIIGELANYTVVDGNNIDEMHRAEMLEAFKVPYSGSY